VTLEQGTQGSQQAKQAKLKPKLIKPGFSAARLGLMLCKPLD